MRNIFFRCSPPAKIRLRTHLHDRPRIFFACRWYTLLYVTGRTVAPDNGFIVTISPTYPLENVELTDCGAIQLIPQMGL